MSPSPHDSASAVTPAGRRLPRLDEILQLEERRLHHPHPASRKTPKSRDSQKDPHHAHSLLAHAQAQPGIQRTQNERGFALSEEQRSL